MYTFETWLIEALTRNMTFCIANNNSSFKTSNTISYFLNDYKFVYIQKWQAFNNHHEDFTDSHTFFNTSSKVSVFV